MSTPPYMKLISEVLPLQRRDFELTVPSILTPTATNPLLDGEWLELDTSAYKMKRGTGNGTVPAYQVFAEKGRYDTQGAGKTTLLFGGQYEAETSLVTIGSLAVNSWLIVGDVTGPDSQTKRGLIKLPTASGTYLVVGYVTKMVGTDKIRYVRMPAPFLRVIP